MTAPVLLLLLAAVAAPTLDSIRADSNAARRSHSAIDYALAAERRMEAAYEQADNAALDGEMKGMMEAIDVARVAFGSGPTRLRNPGAYKYAELKSHELLKRLADLARKMDSEEREGLDKAIAKLQGLHDDWLEAIMGKK